MEQWRLAQQKDKARRLQLAGGAAAKTGDAIAGRGTEDVSSPPGLVSSGTGAAAQQQWLLQQQEAAVQREQERLLKQQQHHEQ